MRRDRKLSWQQHCPELHLLYLQFSGGSVRCQSNTLQASALLQSGTCTDLDCGLNTQYLILNTVWWLQWNKIILIRKKKCDPHVPSAVGSVSFSSADPRVLQSGDVNTWQCFSIHSAGNASSFIVVLLEVVVVVGGVIYFFFNRKM